MHQFAFSVMLNGGTISVPFLIWSYVSSILHPLLGCVASNLSFMGKERLHMNGLLDMLEKMLKPQLTILLPNLRVKGRQVSSAQVRLNLLAKLITKMVSLRKNKK